MADGKLLCEAWTRPSGSGVFHARMSFSYGVQRDAQNDMDIAMQSDDDTQIAACARRLNAVKSATGKARYWSLGYPSGFLQLEFQRNRGESEWYGVRIEAAEMRIMTVKLLSRLVKKTSFDSQPSDVIAIAKATIIKRIDDTSLCVLSSLAAELPMPDVQSADVVQTSAV